MSIIRGMFRISIVVAILLGIVGAIAVHIATIREQDRALNSWKEDTRIWNALRCGGQFLGKDMTAFTNQYGNIDIGRAGCSTASFIANFDEIREALNAPAPPKMTFNYWDRCFGEKRFLC